MGVRDAADFLTLGLSDSQLKLVRDIGWRALVTFHMAYACGYLAIVGIPLAGFAQAEDVKQLAQIIQEDRAERLELAILDARRLQCKAPDDEKRKTYSDKLQELRLKYRQITRQEPRIPACDEV